MSVRVNDRHLSDIEYENTYSKLNEYISSKLRRLPKRYSYFLSRPFNNVFNNIYRDIIELTNLYMSGKQKGIDRYRLCGNILNSFKEVISLSYTYWNLSGSRQNQVKYINKKQREFWTDCNYSVLLRNPQFLHKVEKWKRAEKNQRNVNIQEAKKVVC